MYRMIIQTYKNSTEIEPKAKKRSRLLLWILYRPQLMIANSSVILG